MAGTTTLTTTTTSYNQAQVPSVLILTSVAHDGRTDPLSSSTTSTTSSTSSSSSTSSPNNGQGPPGSSPGRPPGSPDRPQQTPSPPGNQPTPSPGSSGGSTSISSTQSPATTSVTGSKAAGGAQQSASPQPPSHSTNTGLIAAAAVLGGLFLLTLLAFLIYCFRQRRRNKRRQNHAFAEPYETQKRSDSNLEQTIEELKASLSERDAQLRDSQAAMMRRARQASKPQGLTLSDKEAHNRFRQLSKGINDWVLTYFKKLQPDTEMTVELAPLMERSRVDGRLLLGDLRTRYLALRMVVAELLADAINSDELFGGSYTTLASGIADSAPKREFGEWRAQTATLLATNPPRSFQAESAIAVQTLSEHIDALLGVFVEGGVYQADRRLASLRQHVVEPAAKLALDLAAQQPAAAGIYRITMDPAGTRYSTSRMEDVFQEQGGRESKAADGHGGRQIRATIFPTVVRIPSDDDGNVDGRKKEVVISRGQVLS